MHKQGRTDSPVSVPSRGSVTLVTGHELSREKISKIQKIRNSAVSDRIDKHHHHHHHRPSKELSVSWSPGRWSLVTSRRHGITIIIIIIIAPKQSTNAPSSTISRPTSHTTMQQLQLLGALICAALCSGSVIDSTYSFAKSVASNRARGSDRTDTCYNEPLAKLFVGEEAVQQAEKRDPTKHYARNQVPTVVRRHMLIDELMCEAIGRTHGPRQVVILGAGFESRAYRFKHLPVRWFEIDLPEPAIEKERILKENGIRDDPKIIQRVKLDLATDDWVAAIKEAGWDPTAPTFYILEGLIYYMTTEEAIALLKSIPHVPGSRIALSIIERNLQHLYESYGYPKDTWKSNLRTLRKAKAFDMPHYKLNWDSKLSPSRFDLTVSIPKLPARNLAERLRLILQAPCERVLEFVAA
jgi:methyltransferase (TIGR00027 family)